MTAAGTYLARSIGLLILPAFIVAYFAIIPSAPAQQQPGLEVIAEYNGTVAAAREAEVAPRLEGLLSKIDFSAGQLVKRGDLLFEFAPKYNELKLALAQATLKQAEAELQLAEVKLKNKQTLRARNVASEMEFLESQAQRDIAAAKVEEARANVGLAEEDLKNTKLYAPISGIISRPLIKEGAYITNEVRDQSLATIAQLDPINVIGQPPVDKYFQHAEKLTSIEQAAERREFGLILPTGDKYPLKGHLIGGAYEFNPATQTTEVIVEFPNPDYLLRPGLNVTLQSSIREN
jgi:membrane fusion protein (multidrug efflux system)